MAKQTIKCACVRKVSSKQNVIASAASCKHSSASRGRAKHTATHAGVDWRPNVQHHIEKQTVREARGPPRHRGVTDSVHAARRGLTNISFGGPVTPHGGVWLVDS